MLRKPHRIIGPYGTRFNLAEQFSDGYIANEIQVFGRPKLLRSQPYLPSPMAVVFQVQ